MLKAYINKHFFSINLQRQVFQYIKINVEIPQDHILGGILNLLFSLYLPYDSDTTIVTHYIIIKKKLIQIKSSKFIYCPIIQWKNI